jgi:hypothetical protein
LKWRCKFLLTTFGLQGNDMPILYRMLQAQAFDPEVVEMLSECFERVLKDLSLSSRTDPITTLVAERVIECAKSGERDPVRLRQRVLQSFNADQRDRP